MALGKNYATDSFLTDRLYKQHKQHIKTAQSKAEKYPTSHYSPCNCCLSVVLYPEKGAYPENSHVVLCPNKQRSFEPRMCVDLILPGVALTQF